MIDVLVSSDAESDICDGVSYYESKETGLGVYFQSSILADLTSLEILGGTHSKKFGFHRKMSKVFPFWIYYRMESKSALTVLAIVGQRRAEEYVKDRLSNK